MDMASIEKLLLNYENRGDAEKYAQSDLNNDYPGLGGLLVEQVSGFCRY